jgi:DNA-binding response OmpR family regulator
MKILLLEDDDTLSKEIEKFLKNKGFQCVLVLDGITAIKHFNKDVYDLVILDINVPGQNGLKVCLAIREKDKKVPILMLTAFGEIEDKLKAFNNGADDYLLKPFHFEELFVRINSLLKRKEVPRQEVDYYIEDMVISNSDMSVKRAGIEVQLTPKEFKLLNILAFANGKVVSKTTISEKLWDNQVITNQNTIEVYINSLRKKIDKNATLKLIHTKVGYGYFLKNEQ